MTPRIARVGLHVCRGLAAVSGVFSFTVFLLLAASHLQSRSIDPLDTGSLKLLREELRRRPGDQPLQDEFRRLDLIVRRAYFGGVDFRRTGARLLLAGVTILLVSLKCQSLFVRRSAPTVSAPGGGESAESGPTARWLVASVGVAAAGLGVMLAVRGPVTETERGGESPGRRGAKSSGSVPAQDGSGGASPSAPRQREAASAVPSPSPGTVEIGDLESRWLARTRQWPAFRGPDGGARAGGSGYPADWDGAEGRNILWKTALPRPGFNSPVVWEDRVFLTGADEAAREVYALDARDGRLLWRHDAAGIAGSPPGPPAVTPDTGHAAATVATDGRSVFALFSTGDLVALDFEGRRRWAVQLGVPDNPYGHASSLLIWRDRLIVQYDHKLQARVLALAVADGAIAWERFRDLDVSWSTPILIERGGRTELVLNGNPAVIAYDPATGAELWSVPCMGGELATSPAWAGNRVFAANEHARLAAIDLGAKPTLAWEHGRDLPEVSSPLATGAQLVMATGAGVVTALDPADGRVLWRREFDTGFYASPVLAGGLVYLLDRSGVMRILDAAGDSGPRGSPALGEPAQVTPAFAHGRIYLRGERHLFCVGAAAAEGSGR